MAWVSNYADMVAQGVQSTYNAICRGQSGPTIRNYNYHSYSPPPVYGGYGPGYGYGGGGITLMPSFGVPVSIYSQVLCVSICIACFSSSLKLPRFYAVGWWWLFLHHCHWTGKSLQYCCPQAVAVLLLAYYNLYTL